MHDHRSMDLAQFHGTLFGFYRLFLSFYIFLLRISNSFDMSNTEETELVKMRIWRIKIGIALDLHVYMSLY
jgi:hypothetical protein